MGSVMVAVAVIQLTTAGGAGAKGVDGGRADGRPSVTEALADVGKHFSALKGEIDSLSSEFNEAHERERREAEKKRLEAEGAR